MHPTNLVSELRAEVTHWWEDLQKQQPKQSTSASSPGIMSPLLGHMLGEGPLRMISSGQELFVDMDERTLGDLHINDGQVSFVNCCCWFVCSLLPLLATCGPDDGMHCTIVLQ